MKLLEHEERKSSQRLQRETAALKGGGFGLLHYRSDPQNTAAYPRLKGSERTTPVYDVEAKQGGIKTQKLLLSRPQHFPRSSWASVWCAGDISINEC